MSQRPGILSTVRRPANGGESPNAYIPEITAELRFHWPPLATDDEIEETFERLVVEARDHLRRARQ